MPGGDHGRERFADAFAGEFLVPGDELRRVAGELAPFDDAAHPATVVHLQRHFGVSFATIRVLCRPNTRLQRLNCRVCICLITVGVRKERPHPGAQLRFTDIDGHRFTAFATGTKGGGQLADLELRHQRRARCEDRIRCAKDTGLRNLPLQGFAQNQVWCVIVAMACELLAWMAMLALDGPARRWEPKRLRLRIFTCAGRLVRGGRHLRLRLPQLALGPKITTAITRLQALASG